MTAEHWQKVRNLVERAMELSPEDRAAFLQNETDDPERTAEAERLLGYDQQAGALFAIEDWKQRAQRTAGDASLTGMLLGNYRLLDELGRGGMGAVYLAERADGVYQQKVALKVLQENIFTPALVERFRQERQILAGLRHPGIARLLDGGVTPDGRPYLVLEYVDGRPIDVYCDEHKLDTEARLLLFTRVAEAVQSAHQQLVLHLDLKPANVLVTTEGEPRLLDFGIARILSETEGGTSQTEVTLRLLTPRYASPEQAGGERLGVASDVFSLATMLYRLLTGRLPYPIDDASPLEAARMIRELDPVTPSVAAGPETAALLRGDLDTILLQALRKEPQRRYPTVAAFAADVHRHIASEPVLAHADSFRYRADKFLRRNRGTVFASAIAMLILIASAIAVTHSAVVARRQRAIAESQRAIAEARLKDVRALAHSYIFDLNPRLAEVPGTVGVRGFILKNALRYLETMSKETANDDDLAHEVAMGYLVVGEVQADPAMPSLNDRLGAWDSMQKGLAIQKRLSAKHPADLDQLYLVVRQLRNMGYLAVGEGDIVRSDELEREAWRTGQPILAAGPSAKRFGYMDSTAWDLASNRAGNGDLWNFGDPVAALPWLDRARDILSRAAAAQPAKAASSRVIDGMQRETLTRALVMAQLGRNREARKLFEEAIRLVGMEDKTVVNAQALKVVRATYADFLIKTHDLKLANEMAPTLLPEQYREKGHDRLISTDTADTLGLLARIDLESGRADAGRQKMQVAIDTFESLYASDPNDQTSTSAMAHDFYYLARLPSLDAPTRRKLYLRAIAVAEPYAKTHPQVLSATLLIGECHLGLAELAHAQRDATEQRSHASMASASLTTVLTAHPVQPEASAALARARALLSS